MITGISFQPTDDKGYGSGEPRSAPSNPVQEAIKVLSLRLPKVVGAQGIAPTPLLTSQGSGGSRVDSVVNQVLMRLFGEGGGQSQPAAPSIPIDSPGMPSAPSFSGDAQQGFRGLRQQDVLPNREAWRKPPQIIVDEPNVGAEGKRSPFGSLPGTDGSQPPGAFAPAPMWPQSFSLPDKPEPVFER